MPLRLMEMICPADKGEEVDQIVAEHEPLDLWHDQLVDERIMVKVLLPAERAEPLLDELQSRYGGMEGFRILLLAVEAAVPRPEELNKEEEDAEQEEKKEREAEHARISRQELYEEVTASAELSAVYLIMTAAACLVAAIGMLYGNIPVIVGAMVIAPLLGPNIALSFATTLGDRDLGKRALRTAALGAATGLALSLVLGMMMQVTPETAEVSFRARVLPLDPLLALAAGVAGALAVTSGIHAPLVGVMVAVALLPPLVAAGLSLGSAQWSMAAGASLLFLTNLICINLAGVVTFLLSGVRPRTWWEADKAKRASRRALILWLVLLGILVGLILLSQR